MRMLASCGVLASRIGRRHDGEIGSIARWRRMPPWRCSKPEQKCKTRPPGFTISAISSSSSVAGILDGSPIRATDGCAQSALWTRTFGLVPSAMKFRAAAPAP